MAPPHSPSTKRRHPGICTRRSTASLAPCPVLVAHYPPATTGPVTPVSLPDLAAFQTTMDRTQAMTSVIPLIFDTGASVTVTHCIDDFIAPPRPVQHTTLQGIASGLQVHGVGTVTYTVMDDNKAPVTITIGTLYVPGCPSRIICPRQLLAHTADPTANLTVTATAVVLSFRATHISIPYRGPHCLPILRTAPAIVSYQAFCALTGRSESSGSTSLPAPLTLAQQVKLQWHQRLHHVNFPQLTMWMRQGKIKVPSEVINAHDPICSACQFGKAKRQSHTKCTSPIHGSHTKPDNGVSADQLEAGCPGIIPTNKGAPSSTRYHYCNIWIDHYKRFIYLTMHQRKDAKEMLHSKEQFQAFCHKHGVNIRHIHADNGVYASQVFRHPVIAMPNSGPYAVWVAIGKTA